MKKKIVTASKVAIVSISSILAHPNGRLDADYWVGKANGDKAYSKDKKKDGKGLLEENDASGNVILPEEEATKYNSTKTEIHKLEDSIKNISAKVK